jgi:hypothetical protein
MISYLHHVPGRLRVSLPAVKRNRAAAAAVERALAALDGIRAVHANPLTGSVIVRYDPARIGSDGVLIRLLALDLPRLPQPPRVAAPPSVLDGLADRLVRTLLQRFLSALLGAAV